MTTKKSALWKTFPILLIHTGFADLAQAQNLQIPQPPQLSPERQGQLDLQQIIDSKLARLASSTEKTEAQQLAADILSSWRDSGGATIDVLMQRGNDARKSGDLQLARDMFDRVLLIKPRFAEGWNQRAEIFLLSKMLAEAAADLENAIKLEPRHFDAWQRLGKTFEALGENKAALTAYQQALNLHPFAKQAHTGKSRLTTIVKGYAL